MLSVSQAWCSSSRTGNHRQLPSLMDFSTTRIYGSLFHSTSLFSSPPPHSHTHTNTRTHTILVKVSSIKNILWIHFFGVGFYNLSNGYKFCLYHSHINELMGNISCFLVPRCLMNRLNHKIRNIQKPLTTDESEICPKQNFSNKVRLQK